MKKTCDAKLHYMMMSKILPTFYLKGPRPTHNTNKVLSTEPYLFILVLAIPGIALSLILALCSKITPSRAQGTI